MKKILCWLVGLFLISCTEPPHLRHLGIECLQGKICDHYESASGVKFYRCSKESFCIIDKSEGG